MHRLLLFALFLFLSLSARAADPPVQLLLPSHTLDPNSTFELRFANDMVRAEDVGKPATVSPLALEPAVAGRFVWLSKRSGTFAPEGALPLGTKFKLSLRPGTKDAAGQQVRVTLFATAATPPMRVKGNVAVGYINRENATVVPRFLVLFNANVNAAGAAKYCSFVDAAGTRVAARVEQAGDPKNHDRTFPIWQSDDRSLAVWGEKPEEPAISTDEDESSESSSVDPANKTAPRRNVLYVAPVKPLPPGNNWRLVLESGLPAAELKVTLPAPKEIEVGVVQPFQVASLKAESNRTAGRRLILELNKALPEEMTAEEFSKWYAVTPAPADLKVTIQETMVTLKGDFALDVPYRFALKSGLPAREPVTLSVPYSNEVSFERIAPRLYFQDFATHQWTGGTRQMRLLAVNVPRVRVSAKLFKGDAIPAAVKAYDKYQEPNNDLPDESYSRINAETLTGEVVWDQEISSAGTVDAEQTVTLPWDEILGPNKTGAVLLTAESLDPMPPGGKRLGTQTLVQLTDLGAVWKRDRESTFLHLFSLASGKGIAALRLQLLDGEGAVLADATTDAKGNAQLAQNPDARWVFARSENDSHLISLYSGENALPLYRLGVTEESSDYDNDPSSTNSIFMFTERGVYKPGDKLYLKGYARDPQDDQPPIPAGKEVTLTVTDAKEQEILTKNVTLSDFGSFDQEITLPEGSLGKYRIIAAGEKGERLGGVVYFQVQQYKPNAFEITIPKPPETVGDTQLALPIVATYFMGKPLSKAKLTWSLVARDDPFTPEGLTAFAFNNAIYDFRLNRALDRISQYNAQGDVEIKDDGRAQISTPLPVNPKAPQPRAAKLITEVTDLNQQTVSAARAFVQHSSDYYFGLKRFDSVVAEGKPLPIELIAVKTDGKPLDTPVTATIRLSRIKWQTNRLATAGDTSEFESKPNLEKVWKRELATAPGLNENRKPAVASLDQAVADKPGEYLLEAVGKDAGGHDILTSMVFEVSGEAETDWNYQNPYVIDLVADKDSYEPGQTANLLVKTPIAGDALVTVERDRVLRSFIVSLTGNAPAVQVPIADTDGPNVFVCVTLLRGANESPRKIKTPEYRIGYANLKIAEPKSKLTVTVKPAAPSAKPGDTITLEAEVKDSDGKPAADAELVLYAVDEGVLSLTAYETPDPLTFFHQPRGLSVSTYLTLPTLLREDAPESDFANKGYLIGDGKGGVPLLDGLRTNFVATPFWNATVRTDAQGRARAEFKAPDSLTRYRVIAVAATKKNQFGANASAFEINKPIMIESAMPAFANVGDKLVLRAVLHNATDASGTADVLLEVDERVRASETTRQVALGAQQSLAIDIPIEVLATGASRWKWGVKFVASDEKELRDAVEATITLRHPAPLVRQVETRRIEGETAELLRIADPQIAEGSGEVEVSLSNTRVGELRESLHQLLHYPYGCVEQTVSSMLPWLSVRDLRQQLPELDKTDEEIAEVVNDSIARIFTMQTGGGGLSYWPGGKEPMLWGSAYGGLGLALAKKQGYKVPEAEYKKLLKYLSDQLRGTSEDSTGYGLSDRCLAVYTLAVAEASEPAYHVLLAQKRAKLSAEDRALVALAVLESKGPKDLVEQLLAGPSIDTGYIEQWFGSVTRENALQLLAWTQYNPRAPRVDELAVELFARRANGHWQTTQGNTWSLMALANYLRTVETGPRESSGTVGWAQATKPFTLSEAKPLATNSFPITPAAAGAPVTLKKTGGQVFSEVTVSARPKALEHPRQEQGYALTRRYAKIGDDGRLTTADHLRVGDRVLITLDVDTRRRATYVALVDPLPSVLAPINPAFKSQEVMAGESLGNEWVSDYSELREDRALFFIDLLNPGHHTLRYLARVVAAGEVLAPSAKIEEMYHPERFGTTETMRVSAKSLE